MKQAIDELLSRRLNWIENNGHSTACFTIPGKVERGKISVAYAGFSSMHIISVELEDGATKSVEEYDAPMSDAILRAEALLFQAFPNAQPASD